MKKKYKMAILATVVILFITGILAYARLTPQKQIHSKSSVAQSAADARPQIDTAKIKMLRTICSKMDLSKNEILIKGIINAKNGADSAQKLNNAAYVLSRKSDRYYYRIGSVETINLKDLNIFIDHGMKKILLSKIQPFASPGVIPDAETMIKRVSEEGYTLHAQQSGELESISFRNPYNMTCKEYRFDFDKKTLQPKRIFLRMTNFEQPESAAMDNVFELKVSALSEDAQIATYVVMKGVVKTTGGYKLAAGFEDYEMINTL